MNELPIPPAAQDDPRSIELARIWAAGGRQHVTLATGLWNDPAGWGIMLVDLARHVASAYHQAEGRPVAATLARIKQGFDAEWGNATDSPSGRLLEDDK